MSKRLGMLSVAVAVVALAVGAVSSAAGSGGFSKQRKIRVLAVITEVNFVDAGAPGASLGDQIVFSNKLLDGAIEVGHEGAVHDDISGA